MKDNVINEVWSEIINVKLEEGVDKSGLMLMGWVFLNRCCKYLLHFLFCITGCKKKTNQKGTWHVT